MARALFIGSRSPLTAATLYGWLASGNEVAQFWTGDPPGAWRRRRILDRLLPGPSTTALLRRHGIPTRHVPRLTRWPGVLDAVEATGADLLIASATELIVPQSVLDHFGPRAVNFHPSMLPAYRGPSPYVPMLLAGRGDADGGVTLHVLSAGIDEGPIIAQQPVGFTAAGGAFVHWYFRLIETAGEMARDVLPRYLAGEITPQPQAPGGNYARLQLPFMLGPDLTAAEVKQAVERAGSTYMLAVMLPGQPRKSIVTGVVASGPRTGAPGNVSGRSITLDFADARLTLRRANGLDRRLAQLRVRLAERRLQL